MSKTLPNYIDRTPPLQIEVSRLQESFRERVPYAFDRLSAAGIAVDGFSRRLPGWAARAVIAYEYGFASWSEVTAAYRAQDLIPKVVVHQLFEALLACYRSNDTLPVSALFDKVPQAKLLVNAPIFGSNETPLCAVANESNFGLAHLLLDLGADPNLKDEHWAGGYLPIDLADDEMTDLLISRGAVLNIHTAARLGRVDDVRRMIDQDADCVHVRGGAGQTALHRAKNVEICEILLNAGADIDAMDYQHKATPAQFSFNNLPKLRYLIERGARYDLFAACALGNLDLAKAVLKQNPNAVNVESGRELRWDHTGDVLDFKSGRPLTFAYQRKYPELVNLLLEHANATYKLLYYCEIGDEQSAAALVKRYPRLVSRLQKQQQWTLMKQVSRRKIDSVRLMLDIGFDINMRDKFNDTLVCKAAARGEASCLALLLERGAPISRSGWANMTPLELCINSSKYANPMFGDYPTCVKLLIDAGETVPKTASGSDAVMALLRTLEGEDDRTE